MANKEAFKNFVSKHPELVNYVNDGEMTWQKFYEMYDLYGEENEIWNNYQKEERASNEVASSEILKFIKNINLDKLQSGMESIQRVISLISEIGTKNVSDTKEEYTPRPMYKHFED